MTIETLTKKYCNFLVPTFQIYINGKDILQSKGITPSAISVEKAINTLDTFSFLLEDPQLKWINNELLGLKSKVEIKIGYASALETLISAEITSTKTTFPSDRAPQIQITGENKTTNHKTEEPSSRPIATLQYAKFLLNFTAEITEKNREAKPFPRESKTRETVTIRCTAQSVGIPEIKPGAIVALTGLGSKFSRNYLVEKTVHSIGNSGYRTAFEARTK